MSEKPILCNAHTVRAVLDGRQTQDRRPIEPQPIHFDTNWPGGSWFWSPSKSAMSSFEDTLEWWREFMYSEKPHSIWGNGAPISDFFEHFSPWQPGDTLYVQGSCRIKLQVLRVWAERIQDISEADACDEGIFKHHDSAAWTYTWDASIQGQWYGCAVYAFRALWDSLYAKQVYGWDANPLVWATEFERIEP